MTGRNEKRRDTTPDAATKNRDTNNHNIQIACGACQLKNEVER